MGKTYIDTVKYLVYANVEIGGLVEKPDVVGAVFGQTEGLLGDQLDLRELQKNGRIGRIEVNLQGKGGKGIGKILLPSSLDMVETSILAAALETVDRVGPCDAKINVEKIEDTRNLKRKTVIQRAKGLLKALLTNEIPESREISELVRQEVKVAEIGSYGLDKLPSGPNIRSSDSIIIVEGRADVLNLLKNDINNVIAVGGANVPKSIISLCREKEATLFLDGDRGGDIILREISQAAEVDFVTRAPIGREVEELSRKEIIKALRSKIPYEQVNGVNPKPRSSISQLADNNKNNHPVRSDSKRSLSNDYKKSPEQKEHKAVPAPVQKEAVQAASPATPPESLLKSLEELENTLRARLYNSKLEVINEIPVRDLIKNMGESNGVYAIVFDGIITQRLVDLSDNKNTSILIGVRSGNLHKRPEKMLIHTKK
ncbi:MAG: DNA primase DnaG [Candidatus Micrarchaeota archaeon]